jgi:hypothetical protein
MRPETIALRSLLLIAANVINLMHDKEIGSSQRRLLPWVSVWQHAWQDLEDWHITALLCIQPVFERASFESSDSYPIMIFATGAAILTAQLYHTVAYILLNAKPRSVTLDTHGSTSISALWHASRVCAIAVSNRQRSNWDLMMVPMLERSAMRMTHTAQHLPVIASLQFVQDNLGWKVQGVIDRLTIYWSHGEG